MKRRIQAEERKGGGKRGGKEDQMQKWRHNMVMAARVTEIESGE